MPEVLSSFQINQAVCYATPGMSEAEGVFLACAEVFRKGYLMCRKAYLMTRNPVSFGAGSVLSLAIGQNDTLEKVARILLGSLSILRCSQDLHKLQALQKKCRRIVSGKHYIPVKGDRFNLSGSKAELVPQFFDEARFANKMRMEKVALVIATLGEMAVVFGELMLHMGDAYVAFNEECASEVFIHSRDLWDELSSDQSYLVHQLKNNEAFNDWLLGRMNTKTSLCTQMLMGFIAMPSQVRAALPDMRDLSKAANDLIDEVVLSVKSNIKDCEIGLKRLKGIDPLLISNEYYNSLKGTSRDPELTRRIKPPKRIIVDNCC